MEAAVKRFMARDARKIFEAHWEEAKRRLGAWNAGLTLRSFIEKNLKEIDLDPWAQAARDVHEGADINNLRLRYTGSNSPLTYDCLLIFCQLAPTTRNPALFHLESKTLIPVSDSVILFRKGQWYYAARAPIPGEGRQLEDWEYVRCLTARFTLPWTDPPAEEHGGSMDTGA